MPFNVFKARGGSASDGTTYFPFQAIVESAKSGVSPGNFNRKCPCDEGTVNYTSSSFFSASFPTISSSGDLAVTIYSGSMLYSQYSLEGAGATGIKSFIGDRPQDFSSIDCEEEKKLPVMRIYGLNKPIFLKPWFAGNTTGTSRTLKVWLSVCFPTGKEEPSQDEFSSGAVSCYDCKERANVPLIAFISCGILDWPKVVESKLVNKGDGTRPRFEKRQVSANIPIAEIDSKGNVLRQYVNANLVLQDMCLQGIPCRVPVSLFSEFT
jgi:hypothetical protein